MENTTNKRVDTPKSAEGVASEFLAVQKTGSYVGKEPWWHIAVALMEIGWSVKALQNEGGHFGYTDPLQETDPDHINVHPKEKRVVAIYI